MLQYLFNHRNQALWGSLSVYGISLLSGKQETSSPDSEKSFTHHLPQTSKKIFIFIF